MLVNLGYSDAAQLNNTAIASGTPNDGSYTWIVPNSIPCGKLIRVWTAAIDPASQTIVTKWTGNANFLKVTCPSKPLPDLVAEGEVFDLDASVVSATDTTKATGSLIVTKTVVNNTGRPTGTPGFDIDVSCGKSSSRRIMLADGGQETLSSLANGELCTIKEAPPPAPAGCTWTTTYPKGTSVRIGTGGGSNGGVGQYSSPAAPRLDVVNKLVCKGSGDGGRFGNLTIEKQIVVVGSIQPPVTAFTVDVACTPGGPSVPLTLDSDNGYRATVPGIAGGSSCSFNERTPTVPPDYVRRGCGWSVAYPNGKAFGMPPAPQSALRRIVNTWRCRGDGDSTGGGGDGEGGKTGSVTVIKEVVNDSPSNPPPSTGFTVVVSCQPGATQTIMLNAGNSYSQTLTGLPLGATCTVTEQAPIVPSELARRCRWETRYPAGQTVRVTDRRMGGLRIVNRWTCTKGGEGDGGDGRKTGALTIIKQVVNGSPIPPPNTSFTVIVACQPGGTQTVVLNAGNGFQRILTGLPQGAICTITEQPPVVPSELARRCRWETTYPGGQKAEITDRRDLTLNITNQWVCGKAS